MVIKEFLPPKEILFFLTTAIEKSIREKYSYEYKAYWSKVQDEYIMLPSQNGLPDYDCMVTFIMPMSARLKTCNDVIRMGTNGEINLFEKAEYHSLAKMFDTTEQ